MLKTLIMSNKQRVLQLQKNQFEQGLRLIAVIENPNADKEDRDKCVELLADLNTQIVELTFEISEL